MSVVIPSLWLLGLVVLVIVVVLAAVLGWERYRGSGSVSAGARPTAEIFIDPETGTRTRVWYDERTGQREYRPE